MREHLAASERLLLRLAIARAAPRGGRAWVRFRAVLAVDDGVPVARVARSLRVSRPTVYAWWALHREGGPWALLALRGA